MAETVLFPKVKTSLGEVVIDAVLNEGHGRDQKLTKHRVEVGSAITDHADLGPDILTLDCILTNTPLTETPTPGRAEDAYERIRLLQENATLLSVLTTLRTYDNMVITSLSTQRNARERGAVHFTVGLESIRLVQNKTSIVTVEKTQTTTGKKKVSVGKQATTGVNPSEGQRQEASQLKKFKDRL